MNAGEVDAEGFHADCIVVGSGFGGSVSALRLAEQGQRVLVLEAGKRWAADEFPKTNWSLRRYLWMPRLGCFGIQRLTWLRDLFVLSGAGVGGGSLVYANTLVEPAQEVLESALAHPLGGVAALRAKYALAKRMLGASACTFQGPGDDALREVADAMGRGHTFYKPELGVFFGAPGERVPDPYFGGEGPPRAGCVHCGGCMVGCRYGAKNTLDQNYLFLAERRGARVVPETEVRTIRPLAAGDRAAGGREMGGYELESVCATAWGRATGRRRWRARRVVVAAGVLGTLALLFRCRVRGLLPRLSPRLGDAVRTNSETIVGVTERRMGSDHSRGVAISSGFYPEPGTHIELVRYGEGQDAMSLLAAPMTDGPGRVRRWLRFVAVVLRSPRDFARSLRKRGWAQRTMLLLAMQTRDDRLALRFRRSWLPPFRRRLVSMPPERGAAAPDWLPVANETARSMAAARDGFAVSALSEALLGMPTTAHILGGCVMGETSAVGVVDAGHEVFGHRGLFVCDGSVVPANLGVNPALTIAAMTELAMERLAARL